MFCSKKDIISIFLYVTISFLELKQYLKAFTSFFDDIFVAKQILDYKPNTMMNKKQILIIDDHDSTRLLLQYLLTEKYRVIGKTNGLEGMLWLNAGNIPDLILLDINMPELNGKDFLRNLRLSGFFSKIPVLILSNETQLQEIKNFISPSDILGKPFIPENLFNKIKKLNI